MKTAIGVVAVWSVLVATSAANSNLGSTYPDPQCGAKPTQPERSEKFETQGELTSYNQAVDAYNSASVAYTQCVQLYLDNAVNDIERIRQKIDQAATAANP